MKSAKQDRIVLMLTGGIDSTVLFHRLKDHSALSAVFLRQSFQGSKAEEMAAIRLSQSFGVELEVIDCSAIDMHYRALDRLADIGAVGQELHEVESPSGLTVGLAIAAFHTQVIGAGILALGLLKAQATKFGGFIDAYSHSLSALNGADYPVKIVLPFSNMTKKEVVMEGEKFGVVFENAWSCVASSEIHCGECWQCADRKRAFFEANLDDPTSYSV